MAGSKTWCPCFLYWSRTEIEEVTQSSPSPHPAQPQNITKNGVRPTGGCGRWSHYTRTHAHTHARAHARTHARTHAHTHTHTHTHTQRERERACRLRLVLQLLQKEVVAKSLDPKSPSCPEFFQKHLLTEPAQLPQQLLHALLKLPAIPAMRCIAQCISPQLLVCLFWRVVLLSPDGFVSIC